tara:strand:- start:664 stop:1005 length:342 start_codon:yes stop_codon:yes gene_type:complete
VLCKLYKKLCKTLQNFASFIEVLTNFKTIALKAFLANLIESACTFQSAALPTELSRLKLVSVLGVYCLSCCGCVLNGFRLHKSTVFLAFFALLLLFAHCLLKKRFFAYFSGGT